MTGFYVRNKGKLVCFYHYFIPLILLIKSKISAVFNAFDSVNGCNLEHDYIRILKLKKNGTSMCKISSYVLVNFTIIFRCVSLYLIILEHVPIADRIKDR